MLVPASIEEMQDMVRCHERVLAVGRKTKPRLSHVTGACQLISTRSLTGITEYAPSEYTFTALAGTPVNEIDAILEAKGQFLPCSALLRGSGATLGGTIACGLSGPGRFRFGGIRDFLLGIRYVSGEGKLISGGGKVVKNAAGFDIPKFMVGSLGRYGILTEATFKVFPRPSSMLTLKVSCSSHEEAVERMIRAAVSRWELYALDYAAGSKSLYLRLGGPAEAIRSLAGEVMGEWTPGADVLEENDSDRCWDEIRELGWAFETDIIAKVPVTPKVIPGLQRTLESLDGVTCHYSVGGNVAWIATPESGDLAEISRRLVNLNLRGLTIRGGPATSLWLGRQPAYEIEAAVKHAFDPGRRFPSLND